MHWQKPEIEAADGVIRSRGEASRGNLEPVAAASDCASDSQLKLLKGMVIVFQVFKFQTPASSRSQKAIITLF
jgi:hypothetical protein